MGSDSGDLIQRTIKRSRWTDEGTWVISTIAASGGRSDATLRNARHAKAIMLVDVNAECHRRVSVPCGRPFAARNKVPGGRRTTNGATPRLSTGREVAD